MSLKAAGHSGKYSVMAECGHWSQAGTGFSIPALVTHHFQGLRQALGSLELCLIHL